MKGAFNTSLVRSITQSMGRFIAIALIAALGCGFFAGLRMTGADMRQAGDDFYDGTNLYDLRVVSTLGLADDEIAQLEAVEGVQAVMPAYEADALALVGDASYTIRVHSLNVDAARASDTSDGEVAISDDDAYINRLILVEGAWPTAANECVLSADAVAGEGISIGDTVLLTETTGDMDDTFAVVEYTVVGFVRTAYYPSTTSSTMGSTTLGSGTLDDYMYVYESAFADDYPYTEVFITVTGAAALDYPSDEYDALVDEVAARIELLASTLATERTDTVLADANAELADAQAEYDEAAADAYAELADAAAELDEAAAELDEAAATLASSAAELADADAELADAAAELADAAAELADAAAELAQAQAEIAEASESIAQAEAVLAAAEEEYAAGQAEYAAAEEAAEAELAAAQAEIDAAQADYDAAMEQREELAAQLEEAESALAAATSALDELDAAIAEAQAAKAAIQAQIDALDATADDYDEQYAVLAAQLAEVQETLAALEAQRDELAAQQQTLSTAAAQLEAAIAQIDAACEGVPDQIAAAQAELDAQAQAAQAALAEAAAELEAAAADIAAAKAQIAAAKVALAAAQAEYAAGQESYAEGLAAYEAARAEYLAGLAEYDEGAAEYADGVAAYEEGLAAYEEGLAEYDEAAAEVEAALADAAAELAQAQVDIDAIEAADVYVLDRSKNAGIVSYTSDAERIDQIAQLFPLLFFLVAALVALTTMTRMVEEERVLIGTFKALGYTNARITSKYLIYALIAAGVGSVVGIVVLTRFLPWFIMLAYSILYVVPSRPTPIDPGIALASAGLGIGIVLLATWAAARATLRETPAALMLPRAPKAGKRILLEHVRPLWSRMSFSWKVTARNIFRYKQRFFMAIAGVAGCTALLLTGLGLHDAINDILDKQYGELRDYAMTVTLDDDISADELAQVEAIVGDADFSEGFTTLSSSTMMASAATVSDAGDVGGTDASDDENDLRIELVVPSDTDAFADYVVLRERVSGEGVELGSQGVALSEKVATELGVSVGDAIVLREVDAVGNASGEGVELVVAGIVENYVSYYVFMSADLYEEAFGEAPAFTTIYAKAVEDEEAREAAAEELLDIDGVVTAGYNTETIESYRSMLSSVNAIVVLLVVAAALLAFVVLYNLTNINIAERQREIATLKVLGFTPGEVDAYIFRETLLLTIVGAIIGLALGVVLEGFVVVTAEVSMVMFGREIHAASYVLGFVLTVLFAVVVSVFMRGKLSRINMVESLKSVD